MNSTLKLPGYVISDRVLLAIINFMSRKTSADINYSPFLPNHPTSRHQPK